MRSVSLTPGVPEAAAMVVGERVAKGREDVNARRTGDANEALPAMTVTAMAAHAALLSTCTAQAPPMICQ